MLSYQIIVIFTLVNSPFAFSSNFYKDYVKYLPGIDEDKLNVQIFSGFLSTDKDSSKQFHYIFVKSENDPTNDPLLLWINGGPGCSSMYGLFLEIGPYIMQNNGILKKNLYSWSKQSNLLFIDGIAGIGFSFNNKSENEYSNDELYTEDLFNAMVSFYKKYPEMKKLDFFIVGESYVGVIVPRLIMRCLEGEIPVKGYMLVSAVLNCDIQCSSRMFYLYYTGAIPKSLFKNFTDNHCQDSNDITTCKYKNPKNCYHEQCADISVSTIGPYDIYKFDSECIYDEENVEKVDDFLKTEFACKRKHYIIEYMNRWDVKKLLNIDAPRHIDWEICNDMSYSMNYEKIYSDTISIIRNLPDDIRGFILTGNLDTMVPAISAEISFDHIVQDLTEERHFFLFNNKMAGFTKSSKNTRFISLSKAGHMIPSDVPEVSFKILKRFFANENLSNL